LAAVEGDLQRTVGRNLRAYREAQGLSQEAFADVLGVHRTYMGGIERGERNLTLKSLERIADRLDLDSLDLLGQGARRGDGESNG
jgi:transcriptional regulator with XRE-family HTH domain